MPKFRITSPDGKTYEVTAPDGATQQQVMEFAQAQFKPQRQQPQQATYDPTEGMSTTQKVLAGIGSGMTDLAYGAGQRLGLVDQATIDEKRRLDAPLKATTSGTVGNVVGKVALSLPTALIPGANTVAGAGLVGAGMGALEPTAADESVVKNMTIGAAGGAGGVVAGRAIKAGYQGGKALIEPFTKKGQEKIAGRVLQRFSENPDALRKASSAATATGARPTLAEAARDRGVATLQRSLEQQDPQVAAMFAQRAADNNAARVGVVQALAGDQSKRAAAEAAREQAAQAMYGAATRGKYVVDQELNELLSRPAVQQAIARAKTLAQNQGREFDLFAKAPIAKYVPPNPYPTTIRGIQAEEAKRLAMESSKGAFSGVGGLRDDPVRQITGQGLQDLKMAMDEMLSDPASGFAGKSGATVKALRGRIVDWMEKANPEFRAARTSYTDLSKPINQMDVGERLLEKTTGAIRDMGGNQRLQANAFARALNDEQALVRNATGFKGVNSLADVLTPEQQAGLQAVREELELAANLASAANGPGSQTAKSLASQNLLRQLVGPTGLPETWADNAILQTLMRPVQFGMQAAEPRIQQTLSEILLNPDLARQALSSAAPRQIPPAFQNALRLGQTAATQSVPAALVSR